MRHDNNLLLLIFCFLRALAFGFGQTTVFQYCDNTYTLNPGTTYLESPYYPSNYPAGSACRYIFTAPIDYSISVTCDVATDKLATSCSTENIYVSIDGDPLLRGSENFCGTGQFTRQSRFNKLVIAYISNGSWGRFQCKMTVAPQACDCGWSATTRIVNGQQAMINEFPFMVAIRDKSSYISAFCGGSIISHRFIMTAAHCGVIQTDPSMLEALVGDHDLSSSTETLYAARYDIAQIIVHPQYVSDPVQNDIALLKTAIDIQWSRGVGPVCLPPSSMASNTFEYQTVTIAGWGTTSFGGSTSTVLRKATLFTTANSYCQSLYYPDVTIYSSEICTASNNNQDACQYDSGGPVILTTSRAFQLGVISFGKACGIGSPTIGINTRVTSYLSWINQNTGYALCSKTM